MFTGSAVALVTPFKNDTLNTRVLVELIQFHCDHGTDAILVCGTTGEAPTITAGEREELLRVTVETVKGRIPVIMGTGSNNTAEAVRQTVAAETGGADAVLLVTPYYNQCSQEGAFLHFSAIADAVDLPIIPYNVPSRTGFNLQPETLARLAEKDNIVAVKEASGSMAQIAEIQRLCGDRLIIYSGADNDVLPILAWGGRGVISTCANVAPQAFSRMVHAFLEGNIEESRRLQLELKPLVDACFLEVNPTCVKPAVAMLGFEVGEPRLPLTTPSPKNLKILRTAMERIILNKAVG